MSTNKFNNFNVSLIIIFISLAFKIPILLTEHIQEDAFITWKVSRNLIEYGVIGFNGIEKISASTTHLYVFISAIFQLIFSENFIYPLLLFSTVLFTIGTIYLAKILFDSLKKKESILFLILANIIPPALTSSVLGMEYGILFYLYCSLLYFGIYKNKIWAIYLFIILILWTRIDTVIFLGISFLTISIAKRKINYSFIFAGIIGLSSVVLFNFLYFGEIVNHTITSKKIAYPKEYNFEINEFINQVSYYGGFIKKVGHVSIIFFVLFMVSVLFSFFYSIKNTQNKNKLILLNILFLYSITKLFIFIFFKAYFDWYYWIPREFLSIIVIYYLVNLKINYKLKTIVLGFIFLGFYSFQTLQSMAIAFMENNQRKEIANFILEHKSNLNQSIYLEPAGKIPFYTRLKTYDEVGLVNYEVTDEMIKDFPNYWMNFIKKYNPNYILVIGEKPNLKNLKYLKTKEDSIYYEKEYNLIKEYPIQEIHQQAPAYLKMVYSIRPIGQDYYLYQKK